MSLMPKSARQGLLAAAIGAFHGVVMRGVTRASMQIGAALLDKHGWRSSTAPRTSRNYRYTHVEHVPGAKLARRYKKRYTSIYNNAIIRRNEQLLLMSKSARKRFHRWEVVA